MNVFVRCAFCIALLSTSTFLGAGCAQLDRTIEEARKFSIKDFVHQTMQNLSGGAVELDAGDGQITVKDTRSGVSYSVGEQVTIPKDFPKELLVYPKARILAITQGSEQGLNIQVNEFADTVVAWYADTLRADGWKENSKLAVGGYESRSYTKDAVTLTHIFIGTRANSSTMTIVNIKRVVKQ